MSSELLLLRCINLEHLFALVYLFIYLFIYLFNYLSALFQFSVNPNSYLHKGT